MRIHLMMTARRGTAPHVLAAARAQVRPSSVHVHIDGENQLNFPADIHTTRTPGVGKAGYAQCVSQLFAAAPPADLYLFIQDDIEPENLRQLPELWRRLPAGAAALYLVAEQGENTRCGWTPQPRKPFDHDIEQSGWVDCIAFACSPQALQSIDRHVPCPPAERWQFDPQLSSGVGEFLTRAWGAQGLYQVRHSLVRHDLHRSLLNPGRSMADTPTTELLVGRMATVAWRKDTLTRAVESLAGQLHELCLYAGDCEVPDAVASLPWVRVLHGPNIGDRGRWQHAERKAAYVFCVDDDILYPPDYTTRLVDRLRQHGRAAVVGVHARAFRRKRPRSYFVGTRLWHFTRALSQPRFVHVLGTGTLAYHTDHVRFNTQDFAHANVADLLVATELERRKIPRIAIERKANWLRQCPVEKSIFLDHRHYTNLQKKLVETVAWKIPPIPARPSYSPLAP